METRKMSCSVLPRHLRPRREKVFGSAPSHLLDRNAKARVWAAAKAYNKANRQPRQHWGPLTRVTLSVLRVLLQRFHGADGGGRCFPSYERIAAAAECARSSVAVAIRELENAGILTWINRIARIRRRVAGLFGETTELQVVRTSNGYTFIDPLTREPGRNSRKSESPAGPTEPILKEGGARLDGARVIQDEPSQPPPRAAATAESALQGEHGSERGARLTAAERAALVARLDGKPSPADYRQIEAEYDAMVLAMIAKGAPA
jgi:hypothetical protein